MGRSRSSTTIQAASSSRISSFWPTQRWAARRGARDAALTFSMVRCGSAMVRAYGGLAAATAGPRRWRNAAGWQCLGGSLACTMRVSRARARRSALLADQPRGGGPRRRFGSLRLPTAVRHSRRRRVRRVERRAAVLRFVPNWSGGRSGVGCNGTRGRQALMPTPSRMRLRLVEEELDDDPQELVRGP